MGDKELFFAFSCPPKGLQKEMRRFFGVGRGEKQKKKEKKRRRKRRKRVCGEEKKFGSVAKVLACIYNCTLRLPTEAGHFGTLPVHKVSSLRGSGQVPTAPEDFASIKKKGIQGGTELYGR